MENKHPLQSILETVGDYHVRSYSGRAMYGRECLGVEVDGDLGPMIADVIKNLGDMTQYDTFSENGDAIDKVAAAFASMRTDNLGRGTIVYFTEVEYVKEEEKEEEDEDD